MIIPAKNIAYVFAHYAHNEPATLDRYPEYVIVDNFVADLLQKERAVALAEARNAVVTYLKAHRQYVRNDAQSLIDVIIEEIDADKHLEFIK